MEKKVFLHAIYSAFNKVFLEQGSNFPFHSGPFPQTAEAKVQTLICVIFNEE